MAMDAAPQPFFSCLTNGTSSQRAPVSASAPEAVRAVQKNTRTAPETNTGPRLPGGNNHQNEDRCGQRDQNVGDLLVGQRPRGYVILKLLALHGQTRQLFIAQQREGARYLGRVEFHGLKSI